MREIDEHAEPVHLLDDFQAERAQPVVFRLVGPGVGDVMAELIATAHGLRWKVWTENSETREGGGIYLFDDDASAAIIGVSAAMAGGSWPIR